MTPILDNVGESGKERLLALLVMFTFGNCGRHGNLSMCTRVLRVQIC